MSLGRIIMWLITEVFVVLFKILVAICESIVRKIVPKKKDISGQTVLITGAGGGLGLQLAISFAKQGAAKLILWDINQETNERTAAEVRALGKEAVTYTCDCCQRQEIYRVAELVKQEHGFVDILVNNAGILSGKRLLSLTDEQIQETIELNVLANFWTTRSFLPQMMERNHGNIVTISSSAGSFPCAFLIEYCASKHGSAGFTEALRLELHVLGYDGIKTTLVQPLFIDTGISWYPKIRFPMLHPIIKPDDAANEIVSAVLHDENQVFLPRNLTFALLMKTILPLKAFYILNDFLGVGIEEHYPRPQAKK